MKSFIASLSACLFVAGCGEAQTDHAGGHHMANGPCMNAPEGITVHDAWARATTSANGMSAMFMTVCNNSDTDIELIGVATDAAGLTELHETTRSDQGVVAMRRVEGLTAKAGSAVTLAPGGAHVMLMQLTGPISAGADMPLTLELSNGETITATAIARSASDAAKNTDHAHH